MSSSCDRGDLHELFEAGHVLVGVREVGHACLVSGRCLRRIPRPVAATGDIASMTIGNSSASRPCFLIQPQFREDCSAATRPFSSSVTGMLRCARKSAVVTPITPPPTMTTSDVFGGGPGCWIGSAFGERECGQVAHLGTG